MTKLLALDVATNTGWAIWDLDRVEASIHADCFRCEADGDGADKRFELRRSLKRHLNRIIDEHGPDVACLEAPLQYIKTHQKSDEPKKGDLFFGSGKAAREQRQKSKGGPNAETVLTLNQLYGAAESICLHRCREVYEVDAQEWQRIAARFPGATTKDRSLAACQSLRIPITCSTKLARENAADAAIIAVWAKGYIQQIKLERMRRQGEAA